MRLAFTLAALVIASPVMAAGRPTELLREYTIANELCRGGPGDSPSTDKACDLREMISLKLRRSGWCFGRPGEDGAHMWWHRCRR